MGVGMPVDVEKIYSDYKDALGKDSQFNHYKIIEGIGCGANGVAFLAENTILKKNVVIKVYYALVNKEPQNDKPLNEIIKNSSFRLSPIQPVVFDTGITKVHGKKHRYSIMEYLDAITLRDWCEKLDNSKTLIGEDSDLDMIRINAALGLLYSCQNLFDHYISHGDLNPGNIMFPKQLQNAPSEAVFSKPCDLSKYVTCSENLFLVPTEVVFIDYGTSQLKNATDEKGFCNDVNLILKDIANILSDSSRNPLDYLNFDIRRPINSVDGYQRIDKTNQKDTAIKEYNRQLLFRTRRSLVEALIRIILMLDLIAVIDECISENDDDDIKKIIKQYFLTLYKGKFESVPSFDFLLYIPSFFEDLSYYQRLSNNNACFFIKWEELKKLFESKLP